MGVHVIRLPDVGEGVAEAEIAEWLVQVGDRVREDQALGSVMTDKATVEIPSPADGEVLSLAGRVGQVVAVGSDFVKLAVDAEGGATADASAPVEALAASSETAVLPALPSKFAPPAVRQRARQLGIELAQVPGRAAWATGLRTAGGPSATSPPTS
jgi:2-oxoisovalerate dehydrogenase E2 component (dihydrolipoyl transacylase)